MKRYAAFAGRLYYPKGGADDFVGLFESIELAEICIQAWIKSPAGQEEYGRHWWHVLDIESGAIVARDLDSAEYLAERAVQDAEDRRQEARELLTPKEQ